MLSKHHKRYIINHFVIVSAVINALVNLSIGLAIFAGQDRITMWGEPSLGGDIIATVFLLTWITTVLVHWGVGLALTYGRIEPVIVSGIGVAIVKRLPISTSARALCFSVIAMLFITPPVLLMLHLLPFESLSVASAVLFKTLFAVLIGILLTPLIGLLALAKISHA